MESIDQYKLTTLNLVNKVVAETGKNIIISLDKHLNDIIHLYRLIESAILSYLNGIRKKPATLILLLENLKMLIEILLMNPSYFSYSAEEVSFVENIFTKIKTTANDWDLSV
jgi:hypothetical protein